MSGRLVIHAAGPGTTIQDSGRRGYLRFGVSAAGPMDWQAHGRANILASNPENAAAIEVGLGGIEIGAENAVVSLGFAGAPFLLTRDGQSLPAAGRIRLKPEERLTIKPGASGAWFYLSPAGGIDLPPVMGSLSTSLRTGIGGKALAAGDRVPLRAGVSLPELRFEPAASPAHAIRVLPGPQDDYFTPEALERFFTSSWRLGPRSDRMGYRLDGPALAHAKGFNIVSDGIEMGAIQVPGDGKPILLMADRQSTGGYPKLGYVIRADLPRLAQYRAGEALQFEKATIELARSALFAALREMRDTMRHTHALGLSSEFLLSQNLISGARSMADEA